MKHYKDSPAVLVSANHSTNRGNLNPLYNSISAWIEVSIPIHTLANVLLINVRISKERICDMQNAIVMNLNDWKVYSKAI